MSGSPERLPRKRRHPAELRRRPTSRRSFSKRLEERREEDERHATGPEHYTVRR
jgi:hypothetical protein